MEEDHQFVNLWQIYESIGAKMDLIQKILTEIEDLRGKGSDATRVISIK